MAIGTIFVGCTYPSDKDYKSQRTIEKLKLIELILEKADPNTLDGFPDTESLHRFLISHGDRNGPDDNLCTDGWYNDFHIELSIREKEKVYHITSAHSTMNNKTLGIEMILDRREGNLDVKINRLWQSGLPHEK